MTAIEIQDVQDPQRFEATIDGVVAGHLRYRMRGDVIELVHTEVDDAFAGHGVGGALVREAFAVAEARGWTVRPSCPFAAAWVERHPEVHALLER